MSRWKFRRRYWWRDIEAPVDGLIIDTPYGTVHVPMRLLRKLADTAHDVADEYEQEQINE